MKNTALFGGLFIFSAFGVVAHMHNHKGSEHIPNMLLFPQNDSVVIIEQDTLYSSDDFFSYYYEKDSVFIVEGYSINDIYGNTKTAFSPDEGIIGPFYITKNYYIGSPGFPEGSNHWVFLGKDKSETVVLDSIYVLDVYYPLDYIVFVKYFENDFNAYLYDLNSSSILSRFYLKDRKVAFNKNKLCVYYKVDDTLKIEKYDINDLKISKKLNFAINKRWELKFINDQIEIFYYRQNLYVADKNGMVEQVIPCNEYSNFCIYEYDEVIYLLGIVERDEKFYLLKQVIL